MKFLSVLTFFALLIGNSQISLAQTEKVGFMLIESTDSFDGAQKIAKYVSDSLNFKFKNDLLYDKDAGLIDTVTCGCGEQHGYIRRGRFDDGDFVSIELNSNYSNSPDKEVYAIIAMSYAVTTEEMKESLILIRAKFPKAKYFHADVYVGCMH